VQNFYQLLSVDPTSTSQEIKRAFRSEIARYHPDKVQHLGKEFQEMAASRAAALTEAYRTLMNADLRAEYDRLYLGTVAASAATLSHDQTAPVDGASTPPPRFATERRHRDDFVRKATIERFRTALSAEVGAVAELRSRGFDLDFEVKTKKLFARDGGQRYAVKIVPVVDRVAVQDAWSAAQKSSVPICIFLMGSRMASAKELADAITELRKRSRLCAGMSISIIPVDARDWTAYMPADAPAPCRNVLKRLREASTV
jgi:curved DNA-binding protein CbpA